MNIKLESGLNICKRVDDMNFSKPANLETTVIISKQLKILQRTNKGSLIIIIYSIS